MSAEEREMATILAHENRTDRFEAVMKLIKPNVSSILDLGCGIGSLSSLLAEKFPSASVVSIDKSKYLLEQLKRKRMRPNILVIQGDMPVFPLKPESFSLAVAVQVMHEIFHFKGEHDLVTTIKCVYDLLEEGGEFIVVDHRDPGNAVISVHLSEELLEKLHFFRLKFRPRRISYETLRNGWIRISMRDFYDFVTKIWAMGTSLEREEMCETHTPFTELEFARLCKKAGFRVEHASSLTPLDGCLENYEIEVKSNLRLPQRHFVVDVKK